MARFEAVIDPDCPRAAAWREIFGSDRAPILSPLTVRNMGPNGPAEFYRLDVGALRPEQRERLIAYLVARWKLDPRQIEVELDDPEHGVPILATEVFVPIDMRLLI